MYLLRPLDSTHCDAVQTLIHRANAYPWPRSVTQQQLQQPESTYGFYEAGTLLAFAAIQRIFPEVELLNIGVDPAHQGQGLGKMLLETLIAQLTQAHFKRFFLEVRISNHRAIQLYEKLGFCQIGTRPGYYPAPKGREDAVLYAMELLK